VDDRLPLLSSRRSVMTTKKRALREWASRRRVDGHTNVLFGRLRRGMAGALSCSFCVLRQWQSDVVSPALWSRASPACPAPNSSAMTSLDLV